MANAAPRQTPLLAAALAALVCLPATSPAQPTRSAQDIVATMSANEDQAAKNKDHFLYLSKERSERTGGHLWTERVVETSAGRIRRLLAEDDQPLSPDRTQAELVRLNAIAADPTAFERKELATRNDDQHSRQMLNLLAKAFLFSDVRQEGSTLVIDFRPNPAYSPQSSEERVLCAMTGTVHVDPKTVRLEQIQGRLLEDLSLYGFLANIKAGSNFGTTRRIVDGTEWKTVSIDTEINGKAAFFKSIAKHQHTQRTDFARVPNDITVPQAVELAER